MWANVTLSELFDIGSSKRVLKSQWQSTGVPFYRGREITRLSEDGFVDNELFISEELYREFSNKSGVPTQGDIVITAIGTIGNSYIVRETDHFYFKDASVLWLKKASEVSSEFINYWLKSAQMKAQLDEGNGATVDTLTIRKLQALRLKLPTLAEQKRIVAILNKAFVGIDAAIANTEKNLANARELFEAELEKLVEGAVKDCGVVSLSEVAIFITDGDHMPPPKSDEGVPFITIRNIDKNTRNIDFSDTFSVSEEYFLSLKENKKPSIGDVLYTVTGSYGIPVLIGGNDRFCFQRHIGLIRPRPEILSEWVEAVLLSKYARKQADDGATGTAQKTVSLKVLRNLKIPNQQIADQRRLVDRANLLFWETKKLESIYSKKRANLSELKQSFLQRAFTGELTAEIMES